MKTVYRSAFKVGKAGKIPREDIIRKIHQWKGKFDHIAFDDFARGTNAEGEKSQTETINFSEGFGLRFVQEDDEHPEVRWKTDIVVEAGDNPKVSVDLSKAWKSEIIAPLEDFATRPKIVADILLQWPCYNGIRLSPVSLQIRKKEEIEPLVNLITDSRRRVPLVYLSRTSEKGRLLHNPDFLASQLAGIGVVVIPGASCASFDISEQLVKTFGQQEECYNGAARVFWPRVEGSRAPFDRLYLPSEVNSGNFAERTLEMIARSSVYMPIKSFEALKARSIQEKSGNAENASEEIVALYRGEAEAAKASLSDLSVSLQSRTLELEVARQRIETLQTALESRRDSMNGNNSEGARKLRNCLEAFEEAGKFPHLFIHPRVQTQARDSQYQDPQDIYEGLKWINAFAGGQIKGDPIANARNFLGSLGIEYAPNQYRTTMQKYEDEYSVKFKGAKIWLPAHLKKGTSSDPRHSFRLAWGMHEGSAIIGYFGVHQTNRHS